jgi:aminoglycoside 2'-N-acetyltransferase I
LFHLLEVVSAEALDRVARREIIELCELAYQEDFNRLFETMPGSIHVLARDEDGVLISHAEWVTRWLQPAEHPILRTAYIEAVATRPSHQRRGLATAVLRCVGDAIAADATWELGGLSPSDPAFYARLGWELWSGPLAIRCGEAVELTPASERVMILRLPRTPATLAKTALLTAEWRDGEPW